MSNICGYDCRYNKSGVCQITGCIKKSRLVSTMYGINVDDLMSTINRLKKVPTYNDLLRENKKQKEVIDKITMRLEYFLIGNLKYQSSQEEFIKLLNILKEVER